MRAANDRPRVSVFGLGYVGSVSAACFAHRGHQVVGVDVEPQKLELVRSGRSPIVEERIGDLFTEATASGRLTVTDDARAAVSASDVSLVCVGSPSEASGAVDTRYLVSVTEQLGDALRHHDSWHTVVFRSTMPPGTCERLLIPLLEERSGRLAGVDFGVAVNPEFLREGSSVRDFFAPPKTVIGTDDPATADLVAGLYEGLPGPVFRLPFAVAELVKYVDNSFHALKVDFANEVGTLCSVLGIDSYDLMDVFLADTKLNVSPAYLRPGYAFGGSCLPKDVRALLHFARQHDVDLPLLFSILPSNHAHAQRALTRLLELGRRRVGIYGLAFKGGTDDLRESPMVELAERLVGKGFQVRIYDPNVALSRLLGANRSFIDERLPHLAELLTDDPRVVAQDSEVLVAASTDPRVVAAIDEAPPDVVVLDLVRLPGAEQRRLDPCYQGLGW